MEISLPAWLEIRAHIGFICTFRFTPLPAVPFLSLSSLAPSRRRISILSSRTCHLFSSLLSVWFPLSSTTQFTNRRLTVGKGGREGAWDASRGAPNFRRPVGRKGWNERDPRLVTAQNGSPFDSRLLSGLPSLVSRLLPDASAASFVELFNLPPSSPASPVLPHELWKSRVTSARMFTDESAGVPRRYLRNVNFPVIS